MNENKELNIADLIFCMYLIRIYGKGFAEQYIGSEKKKTIQNIQQFLQEAASFIIDKQSNEEKSAEVSDETISKEIEKMKNRIEENRRMQERFEADLNQLKKNRELLNQKEKQGDDSEKTDKKI